MSSGNHLIHSKSPSQAHTVDHWGRREFAKGIATLAAAAGLSAYDMRPATAEPEPETTSLRMVTSPALCFAPQYIADALLRAEGFTDVQYIQASDTPSMHVVATGEGDFTIDAVRSAIMSVDAGDPLVLLSGVHLGCYELFGTGRVRTIKDLRGSRVAVYAMGNDQQVFLASMAAYVGLNPARDINWVVEPPEESMRHLQEGKIDAYLAFPPEPQELRAKKIGRVIVNTATERPWSQYFCCMLIGNRQFVARHPVASKRALRAVLKATDLCAREPERAARLVVDKGYASSYDIVLETLKDVNYDAWRSYDVESTLRFFAVRMHEAGMIKSTPQKIIAQGTDWRFLNELKRELKA